MKEKMTGMQGVEKKGGVRWKLLPTAALLYALSLPQQGYAKSSSGMDEGIIVTEVAPQMEDKKDDIIDLGLLVRGTPVKDSDEGVREGDEDQKKPQTFGPKGDEIKISGEVYEDDPREEKESLEKKESRIGVSGFLQVGTSIVPDFASICSDKPSMLLFVDATDSKTGLGMSYIRLDDFHKDPDYPVSRASVLVPHRSKTLGDGKRTVGASVECTYVDNDPDSSELLPFLVGTYDTKTGWVFEGKYFHEIMKGPDADAFRLGITKKIGDALSLTAQGWYKSDYDGKFFGRVVADIDIGNGLGVQVSGVAKDGKITPTAGVIYKF